jgi:Cu+-exporting ATPase
MFEPVKLTLEKGLPVHDGLHVCAHCGGDCAEKDLLWEEKHFCCDGCQAVYEILNHNGLCRYYAMDERPGSRQDGRGQSGRFGFLDDSGVRAKLIRFSDGTVSRAVFYIPQMHCSACIWLLENLWKLHPGIRRSQVNFLRREAQIDFAEAEISLREVVEWLAKIGYEPQIKLIDVQETQQVDPMAERYIRLGIAFFCWGNVMMLSFPEYLGLDALAESSYRNFFGYLNFALSLPVLFYSATEFFVSAWTGLKQRQLNIDVPIVIGVLVMHLRSSWEVFSGTGAGYFDTFVSLIFLMLVGRLFQNKSYHRLSFERDYRSYFPVGVMALRDGEERSIPVSDLQVGERLVIRHGELIPADSMLLQGSGSVDYSFVTGESAPVPRSSGELLYAGGRQMGGAIEVEVVKPVSQSYLTQLWNDQAFAKDGSRDVTLTVNRLSQWFTPLILLIATAAGAYWLLQDDPNRAFGAFTAILIITCPCALALSSPFTLGNALRIFGRHQFYLKNAAVVERLSRVDYLVFDKTGTLTDTRRAELRYEGEPLSTDDQQRVHALTRHSAHPMSRRIYDSLGGQFPGTGPKDRVEQFEEITGKGIHARVNGVSVALGSGSWVSSFPTPLPEGASLPETEAGGSRSWLRMGDRVVGSYVLRHAYREGFAEQMRDLQREGYGMALLSGDNETEKPYLLDFFADESQIRFRQSPADKLEHVNRLRTQGHTVMMTGDGLNDAGALRASDVGIAIAEDANHFSPACDAILEAGRFAQLGTLLRFSRQAMRVLMGSFALSLLYNAIGIGLALPGTMSPLVAAILMPISSVTIIGFTTLATNWSAKKLFADSR